MPSVVSKDASSDDGENADDPAPFDYSWQLSGVYYCIGACGVLIEGARRGYCTDVATAAACAAGLEPVMGRTVGTYTGEAAGLCAVLAVVLALTRFLACIFHRSSAQTDALAGSMQGGDSADPHTHLNRQLPPGSMRRDNRAPSRFVDPFQRDPIVPTSPKGRESAASSSRKSRRMAADVTFGVVHLWGTIEVARVLLFLLSEPASVVFDSPFAASPTNLSAAVSSAPSSSLSLSLPLHYVLAPPPFWSMSAARCSVLTPRSTLDWGGLANHTLADQPPQAALPPAREQTYHTIDAILDRENQPSRDSDGSAFGPAWGQRRPAGADEPRRKAGLSLSDIFGMAPGWCLTVAVLAVTELGSELAGGKGGRAKDGGSIWGRGLSLYGSLWPLLYAVGLVYGGSVHVASCVLSPLLGLPFARGAWGVSEAAYYFTVGLLVTGHPSAALLLHAALSDAKRARAQWLRYKKPKTGSCLARRPSSSSSSSASPPSSYPPKHARRVKFVVGTDFTASKSGLRRKHFR
ncbi:hypothetical protein DIPPA_31261 [Diplonema papillatum]|nr:hypothetical protein DIPPA_31261 [Diplonema papillatum]|eukprot:gene7893-12121_t